MPASASLWAARDVGANPSTLYPCASAPSRTTARVVVLPAPATPSKPHNLLSTDEDLIHRFALRTIQLRVAIFCPDSQLWRHQHRIAIAPLIAALHMADDLALHPHHLGSRIQWRCSTICSSNLPKLPTRHPLFKLLSYLAVGSLSHAAVYSRLQDRAFVLNSGAFKDMVARIRH